LLFSEGFRGSAEGRLNYEFFFPGTLAMILLFTAIFATISIIEDRNEGFLQSVLIAPLPRWSMVLGKVLGGTLLALLQAGIFLALGLATIDLNVSPLGLIGTMVLMAIVGFALSGLGFLIAWRMESTQGFHAIMSVLLLPMWLLSGSFFPQDHGLMAWIAALNPLTYGVAGLRQILQSTTEGTPSPALCWSVSIAFAAVTFGLSCRIAASRTRGDLL
ncbi:MAG: ABC transporter permease, partial [Planctomycetales bacterium]|nr:ABC transporter permease [Planctomycetales bacterium]